MEKIQINISASKLAALIGCNPYESSFQSYVKLFNRKKQLLLQLGDVVELTDEQKLEKYVSENKLKCNLWQFKKCKTTGDLDKLEEKIAVQNKITDEDKKKEFKLLIISPLISSSDKLNVINTILSNHSASDLTIKFGAYSDNFESGFTSCDESAPPSLVNMGIHASLRQMDTKELTICPDEDILLVSDNSHDLITAASVAINGIIVWRYICSAQMIMRKLSKEFLNEYLEDLGSELHDSVGAYKLEKNGAQLFKEVKGDFFCILGLPLLSLLNYFRENKILKS